MFFTCFLHFIEKYKHEYRKTKLAVWVSTSGGKIPDNAIRTGYEKDGKLLFIARAKMRGKWTSAKCGPYLPGAYIPYNCKEIIVKN